MEKWNILIYYNHCLVLSLFVVFLFIFFIMPVCVVKNCTSGSRTSKIAEIKPILHRFPKEEYLQKLWIELSVMSEKIKISSARVCSLHFDSSDYEKPLIQRMLQYSPKHQRKLKPNAVPSKNLPRIQKPIIKCKPVNTNTPHSTHDSLFQSSFQSSKAPKEKIDPFTSNNKNNCLNDLPGFGVQLLSETQDVGIQCEIGMVYSKLPVERADVSTQCGDDLNEVENLKQHLLDLHLKLKKEKEHNLELQNTIKLQKEIINSIPNNTLKEKNEIEFNKVLSGMFTETQIKLLLYPNKKVYKWTENDIANAITLRSLSPKAYRYLREEKKYPLPGLSTLRGWATKFPMDQGILSSVLSIMKHKSSSMTDLEKITVLAFDETYLSQKICYDKKKEQFIGPHKCVQTVVARGLIASWRQPIFYMYDTRMTKDILFNIITALHESGYNVVSTVSDMGPTNVSLWNSLGISINKTYFDHPETKNKIYIFADVPHLLKLARNHFVNSGYNYKNKFIGKQVVEKVLNLNKNDLRLAYKITNNHINIPGPKKQSVSLAAQLFSNSLAKAISYCGQNFNLDYNNWQEASWIIQLFNDWFDLFNTQLPVDKFIKSYGMDLENQNKLLKTMDNFILEMRVVGHKTLLPFQKGILYSNQSLRNLLIDLKLKYPDISYIITRRLNQDILENLFSYLKAMSGANTHLSPLDFKHCLKWYLLGKHASIALSQNRNTEDTIGERLIDTECLSASIVKESEILQTPLDNDHMSTEELSYSAADNHFLVLEEDKDLSELTESATIRTVEHEALEYVVGYVARRFVHKYPDLGNETSVSLDSSLSTSWTQHITRGHLITPSDTLMRVAKVMNKYFEEMHGTSLNKNPKVMETLKTKVILESNDVLPEEVVSCLIRTRTFVRFNHLNKSIADNAPTVGNKTKIRKFLL